MAFPQRQLILAFAIVIGCMSVQTGELPAQVFRKVCGENCTHKNCILNTTKWGYYPTTWRRWSESVYAQDPNPTGTMDAPGTTLPSPNDEAGTSITTRSGSPNLGTDILPPFDDELTGPADSLPDLDITDDTLDDTGSALTLPDEEPTEDSFSPLDDTFDDLDPANGGDTDTFDPTGPSDDESLDDLLDLSRLPKGERRSLQPLRSSGNNYLPQERAALRRDQRQSTIRQASYQGNPLRSRVSRASHQQPVAESPQMRPSPLRSMTGRVLTRKPQRTRSNPLRSY